MTQQIANNNRRLMRNTLMLYLRMFVIMLVSLYTSRVLLEAIGVMDYGIYNVVTGVVVLFVFINNAMVVVTQVNAAVYGLSCNYQMAFNSQITKYYAAEEFTVLRGLTNMATKTSFFLVWIFVLHFGLPPQSVIVVRFGLSVLLLLGRGLYLLHLGLIQLGSYLSRAIVPVVAVALLTAMAAALATALIDNFILHTVVIFATTSSLTLLAGFSSRERAALKAMLVGS